MKIGVWIPDKYVTSVRIYYQQIRAHLSAKGVEFTPFSRNDKLPKDVDLYWDPTCTGGKSPNRRFAGCDKPLIATVHGASNFSMPLHYTYHGWKNQIKGYGINLKRKLYWNIFRNNIDGIITVSEFAKKEIIQELNLPEKKIQVIYHGYDSAIFNEKSPAPRDYLLHVSSFHPIKNIPTLIEAYRRIDDAYKIPLVLIVPNYPNCMNEDGITLINQLKSQEEIASYMKRAKAFVLPSIRESFGLPLIESMACGTPAITSTGSACEEIVGDAGILCPPLDIEKWRDSMQEICSNIDLWKVLSEKSIKRAKKFSWEKSAEAHYLYFKSFL